MAEGNLGLITQSKTVLVTGSTGGIGSQICLQLADDGYDIVGHFLSQEEKALNLQRAIRAKGRNATMIRANLASNSEVEDLIEAVRQDVAQPSRTQLVGLVNNAGSLMGPSFGDVTFDRFDEYIAVNARAPLFLIQELSREMVDGSSIVNVSSVATKFSSSSDLVYAISKAALEALTFHAADGLGRRGIRINTVLAGFTDNGNEAFSDPLIRTYMSSYSTLGGVAEPRDVARAISFLLSSASRRTTGALLDVSGGSALGRTPRGGSLREHLG